MEDCLHTSSDNLSKLVRWAHSHGTICALIPNLKHLLTEGSHGNLTAMWGCSAGHAYHWPLTTTCKAGQKERTSCYQDSRSINSDSLSLQGGASALQSPAGERFLGRSAKSKGDSSQTHDDSCDFSNCSEPSEGDDNTEEYNSNLFDIVCESSATDEDGDYEPHHTPRKRGRPPGAMPGQQRPGDRTGDNLVKKIKQETAEDYYTVANAQLAAGTDSGQVAHSVSQLQKPNPQSQSSLSHTLPHKSSHVDGDSLGVSASTMGRSSPHTPKLPHGPASSSQSKPPLNHASPGLQDLPLGPIQSFSTAGAASQLPGPTELMEGLASDDLLKSGGTTEAFGDLSSSPDGLNSDLDLMAAQALCAATEPKREATGTVHLFLSTNSPDNNVRVTGSLH